MPLVVTKTLARFEDVCAVEDALPLLDFLKTRKTAKVDLSACTYLHTALLQLLLAARPKITALPVDPVLARWSAGWFGNMTEAGRHSCPPSGVAGTEARPTRKMR